LIPTEFVVPVIPIKPPEYMFSSDDIPPLTVKAPVVFEVDVVISLILVLLDIL
jgi:hypothetical protein